MIAVYESAKGVRVQAAAPIRHLCPHKDEIDDGRISITWITRGSTLELHALREHLDNYADTKISHEHLTETIMTELSEVPGVELESVETTWITAGVEVTCTSSTSRTRQAHSGCVTP